MCRHGNRGQKRTALCRSMPPASWNWGKNWKTRPCRICRKRLHERGLYGVIFQHRSAVLLFYIAGIFEQRYQSFVEWNYFPGLRIARRTRLAHLRVKSPESADLDAVLAFEIRGYRLDQLLHDDFGVRLGESGPFGYLRNQIMLCGVHGVSPPDK